MRLDLTAAEHTNCPRLLRRFGLLAVVLVLRGAELESGRADAREPVDPATSTGRCPATPRSHWSGI